MRTRFLLLLLSLPCKSQGLLTIGFLFANLLERPVSMKNTSLPLLLFLLLVSCLASAQSFEGTIKYNMKVNLPKEQQEQLDKMAQMGYAVPMPTGFEITSKAPVTKMKMLNGKSTFMEFVTLDDKKESYLLNHKEKKAYKMPEESEKSEGTKPKVTKTSESTTIAGYKCTKYIVEYANQKTTQHIWAATDIKMPASAFKNSMGGNRGGSLFMEGIEGVPLKMTVTENGSTSEMTATEVNRAKLNIADLQVPAGYTVEPFNAAAMTRMMMGGMGN